VVVVVVFVFVFVVVVVGLRRRPRRLKKTHPEQLVDRDALLASR
jgi:hypothetical protein